MAAARLPGYRRLAGPSRRYEGPGGERISYREYRHRLEAADAVHRLNAADLANRRKQQRAFNDIINQMAKVRARALDNAIENAQAAGSPPAMIKELQRQRRTVKSAAIKAPSRKEALKTLKEFHHRKDAYSQQRLKEALIALGRRDGVPDWVDVGESDAFRRGTIRRLPQRMRR